MTVRAARPRAWWDEPVEEYLAAFLLGLMVLIAIIGTLTRYLLHNAIPYLEQFTPELFVWASLLGAAAAARRGAHLGTDALTRLLPPGPRQVLRVLVALLAVTLYAVMIVYGSMSVLQDHRFQNTDAIGLPNWWITAAFPVCGLLLVVRTLQALLSPLPDAGLLADEADGFTPDPAARPQSQ